MICLFLKIHFLVIGNILILLNHSLIKIDNLVPQRGITTYCSDGVDERHDGNHGCVAVPDGGHHIGDYLRWDQRTRGVMNEDHVDVIRQCYQCPGDRFRSRFSPRHNENLGGELLGLKQRTHVFSVIRWSGDDHNVDNGTGGGCLHRMDQHRSAGDFSNGFRGSWTEAFTLARCGNEGGDAPVANVVAHDELIRKPGPRRGWPRPCPRRSSLRALTR